MTLAEFLLARLDEDEADALAAAQLAETPWRAVYGRQVETAREGYLVTPEDEHSRSDDPTDAVSEHIARHDPARVLADVAAKRAIVERCSSVGALMPSEHLSEGILRHLASVYADHPDYDEAWRA